MFDNDFKKSDFIKFWGEHGYTETWQNYTKWNYSLEDIVNTCIIPYSSLNNTVLELGCGSGIWTKFLKMYFKKCICIDVIKKPSHFVNIDYIEIDDNDYTCSSIEDNSIDFIWSFGLFCHLSYDAKLNYLYNIRKKLKENGMGVIMFANGKHYWPSNDNLNSLNSTFLLNNSNNTWFYDDPMYTVELFKKNSYTFYQQLIPEFRDSLFLFKK